MGRKIPIALLYDEGLAATDDMAQDDLFKVLLAQVCELGKGDAQGPAKVGSVLDERVEVEIWRQRVKFCLGME